MGVLVKLSTSCEKLKQLEVVDPRWVTRDLGLKPRWHHIQCFDHHQLSSTAADVTLNVLIIVTTNIGTVLILNVLISTALQ